MTVEVREAVMISVSQLHPNSWNPNVMSSEKFSQLTQKIQEEGFGDPLRVAVIPKELYEPGWEVMVPHYRIIAGEHRWRVGRVLEMPELPCHVYTDWDEAEQKLRTVRDNLVTGELDAKKFTEMVKTLDSSLEVDPHLFGFEDQTEMDKFLIREKDAQEKSFLDGLLNEANKQQVAVDSLSDIVSNIFVQSAETLDQSYLMFTFKGQTHCVVLCTKDCFVEVEKMTQHLQATGGDINDFMQDALRGELKSLSLPHEDAE